MSECECEIHQVQIREPALEARMETMNNYARTGDIRGLYTSIKDNPQLLKDMDKVLFIHTPLHEAAALGQTSFALEILNLMPSFGKKLNPEGLSPLHVALENKNLKTARSLVRMDKQLVRVKAKEGFTPLHLAAKIANGNNYDELEILADFLHECPESIHDLTNRFQTAVHVALEYDNGSSALLLNWITRTLRSSILASQDVDGNTALRTAVQYDRAEEVQVLVKFVKLNPKNVSDKTPLDIAEEHPTETAKILIHAGARKADQLPKLDCKGQYLRSKMTIFEYFFHCCFSTYRNFVLNLRSDIMVVAVLITTATYQAVLQPPGGVYPPEGNSGVAMSDAVPNSHESGSAGKTVMKLLDYHRFMPANTAAFTLSIVMISLVVPGRLSSIFLILCLIFLTRSYYFAMNIISNSSMLTTSMFFICTAITDFAFSLKLLLIVVKALIDEVWTTRLNIIVHNQILDRWVGRCLLTQFPILGRLVRHYHLIEYGK